MVNIDGENIVYERLQRKIKKDMKDNKIITDIKFYAFASNASEKVQ